MFNGPNLCSDRPKRMDPLSDILTLLRPNGYGFRGLDAAGDWALAFAAADGIRCFAIEMGGCWLRIAGGQPPIYLGAGDIVLLTGGAETRLYSHETAQPIDAVTFLLSVPVGHTATLNSGGECRGLGGFFGFKKSNLAGLLSALPQIVHVRSDDSKTAIYIGVKRLMKELSFPRPGGKLLANHLAQELLIEALRAHLEQEPTNKGWLALLAVPALYRALTAMHEGVARRLTVRELADTAGMSRSSFAAHFERVAGETPIAYLTRWRMILAADRLQTTSSSLFDVAASVGYGSESAFGAAFKRVLGYPPRRFNQHNQ